MGEKKYFAEALEKTLRLYFGFMQFILHKPERFSQYITSGILVFALACRVYCCRSDYSF